MDSYMKNSLYQSRMYQLSLTTEDNEDKTSEYKRTKKLAQQPINEDILKKGLHSIGKCATGDGFGFLGLNLNKTAIYSLQGIEKYKFLQQIDVSNNNLITLKPISALKHVTHLYASNNQIKKMADFMAPDWLEVLDLSFNEITEMVDMTKNRFLKKLYLNNNQISVISGVQKNKNLEVLNLNFNNIQEVSGLDNLNLNELHLFSNSLKTCKGINQLPRLRILDLSRNSIKRLKGLGELHSLRKLYLSDNVVSKLKHLDEIVNLPQLSDLDLCFNPIQKKKFYRYQVTYKLPQLRSLDGVSITPQEAIKAENFFGEDVEDRQRVFNTLVPEEDFIDRRIHRSEFLDPESDSEIEDLEIVDEYDKSGQIIKRASSLSHSRSGDAFNRSMGGNSAMSQTAQSMDRVIKTSGSRSPKDPSIGPQSPLNSQIVANPSPMRVVAQMGVDMRNEMDQY